LSTDLCNVVTGSTGRFANATASGVFDSQSTVSRQSALDCGCSVRRFKRSVSDENEDISRRRLGYIGANDKRMVEEGTH